MAWCARIHHCRNRTVTPSAAHRHHLEAAPAMSCCARLVSGFGWLVSRPFVWAHAAYNGVQLAKKKELAEPIMKAVDYSRPITPFPFPNMMIYIVSNGMEAFLKSPRHDPLKENLFADRVNYQVFLPILEDVVRCCDRTVGEESGVFQPKRTVNRDDFLFTCSSAAATRYREVILKFMGPINQKRIREELEEAVKWISEAIPPDGRIEKADEFCGTFTAGVISRLFLNHPGPKEAYRKIYWAMHTVDQYAMQRRWGKLSAEAEREYQSAIAIIAEAIHVAEKNAPPGSFVDTMKASDFTDTQIKGMLFLVYLAGSGTTTTALKYLLWQLGQHREYQTKIRSLEGSGDAFLAKVIAEALRLAPPVGVIGRFAACDLTYSITERDRVIYSYIIPKGACILVAQLPAALDPRRFTRPKDFNPERFAETPFLPWLPFSAGFHACPGRTLALAELSIFVSHILERYQITSLPCQPDLKAHLFLTLHHPTPVELRFHARV